MANSRLNQWHQLLLVARKTPAHKGGAYFDGQSRQVDRRIEINVTLFIFCSGVHGRGILTFGQAVTSIILDDVGHVEVASDHVGELTQTNRRSITVTGNTNVRELSVGQICPGCYRGHSTMHAVKAVGAREKIGRSLGRAANS